MSIEASVKALHKKIDLAKLRAEKRVTAYVEERVKTIFKDIVVHSPQFTGTLASNWYIEFGTWVGTSEFKPTGNYVANGTAREAYAAMGTAGPYIRGADPAVSATLAREFLKLNHLPGVISGRVRWNSKVYFVNTAPYADEVDQDLGPKAGLSEDRYDIRRSPYAPKSEPDNRYYGKVFMMTRAKLKYPELK